MTSNSGRDGHCERCGCADNNHTFGICAGRSGKGPKSAACTFEWSRCSTGGHNDIAEVQYVDCQRCPDHPGAPPSNGDFWGTQPEDTYKVPTADELGIPWPEPHKKPEGSKGQRKEAGHIRVNSGDSEDPLQWDEERYMKETAELVESFGKSTISNKTSPAWSKWSWSWSSERWSRYRIDVEGKYEYDYQEDSKEWSDWSLDRQTGQYFSSARDPDGQPHRVYRDTPQEISAAPKRNEGKGKARR